MVQGPAESGDGLGHFKKRREAALLCVFRGFGSVFRSVRKAILGGFLRPSEDFHGRFKGSSTF